METRNERETKVISIKTQGSQAPDQNSSTPAPAAPADFDWGSIMKRNSENVNRSQTDRDKANKGVIRSYRLKH
ncbi:MAG: hypothetical protein H7318_20665 [Oligoflexus sp.]|nr:hypothetical protein [Oligoflexus sp.]